MTHLKTQAAENLGAIRSRRPLIHNITNYVVMNTTANALLATGASPVMAHAIDEVSDMVAHAGSLVLNIGTLSDPWVTAMLTAGKRASELGVPVILDPVGAGATPLRTDTAKKILSEVDISVVRGNASEILALGHIDTRTKGVDAVHSVDDTIDTVGPLAKELGTVLAVTDAVDLVTNGRSVIRIENGHPLMTRVTGMGCIATAMIGAFAAVDEDPLSAAATALAYIGLAGEIAAEKADAPGSFMVAVLDALYTITPETLASRAKTAIES